MQRISGTAVKAAASTAAIKHVAVEGFHVGGSHVSFDGKQAFASWNGAGTVSRNFRINYPALADDALLTRIEADLVAAYTLHETGHVLYTNNKPFDLIMACRHGYRPNDVHSLANGLEDGRMEASVIRLSQSRGARPLLLRLLNKLTSDISGTFNPTDLAHASFALAMLSREAFGYGNAYTATVLARIPEPYKAIYQKAYDACLSAPMGYDATCWHIATASDFLHAWSEMRRAQGKDTPPPQPPQPPQPPEDNPGDGDDYRDDGEQPDDDGEFDDREEDTPEAEQPKTSSPPSEDDGDADDADGDDADAGDDGEDGDADAEGEGDDAEGSDGDGEDADSDDGGSDSDGGEGEDGDGTGNGDAPFDPTDMDSGEPQDAEPKVDDVFQRANKRTSGSKKSALGQWYPASIEDDGLQCIEQWMKYVHECAERGTLNLAY